jgi:hypothetical protein
MIDASRNIPFYLERAGAMNAVSAPPSSIVRVMSDTAQ